MKNTWACVRFGGVTLVPQGCHHDTPPTVLITTEIHSITVLEATRSKERVGRALFLLKFLFLLVSGGSQQFLEFHHSKPMAFFHVGVCVPNLPLLSLIMLPVTEFRAHSNSVWSHFNITNYICRDLVSEYAHILRFWKDMNLGLTLFNPVHTPNSSHVVAIKINNPTFKSWLGLLLSHSFLKPWLSHLENGNENP